MSVTDPTLADHVTIKIDNGPTFTVLREGYEEFEREDRTVGIFGSALYVHVDGHFYGLTDDGLVFDDSAHPGSGHPCGHHSGFWKRYE
jgi:hypothetical protein